MSNFDCPEYVGDLEHKIQERRLQRLAGQNTGEGSIFRDEIQKIGIDEFKKLVPQINNCATLRNDGFYLEIK